jgi:hypothetical protein
LNRILKRTIKDEYSEDEYQGRQSGECGQAVCSGHDYLTRNQSNSGQTTGVNRFGPSFTLHRQSDAIPSRIQGMAFVTDSSALE